MIRLDQDIYMDVCVCVCVCPGCDGVLNYLTMMMMIIIIILSMTTTRIEVLAGGYAVLSNELWVR